MCDQKVQSAKFDHVVVIEKARYGSVRRTGLDKILQLPNSPYSQTLYLDADTFICGSIEELFDLLTRFDIAAAHDTFRMMVIGYQNVAPMIREIPSAFPMYNSGVIAYNKTEGTSELFSYWLTLHYQNLAASDETDSEYCADQTAFRKALYESKLRIATIPPEYNCRFVHPVFLNERVNIFHGPDAESPELHSEINSSIGNRIFMPETGTVCEGSVPLFINAWRLRRLKERLTRYLLRAVKRAKCRIAERLRGGG
jgi:hypothetical protein